MKTRNRIISILCITALLFTTFGTLVISAALYTPVNASHWEDKTLSTNQAYSFVFVGDTQSINNTTDNSANAATNMNALYKWIVDNKDTKKIAHVFGLGDITEHNYATEWQIAQNAISQMDGVVPYTLVRGNHDGRHIRAELGVDSDTEDFNNYFGKATGYMNTLGGTYDGTIDNSWKKFDIAGHKYLFLQLDYFPSDAVLSWASDIIEANSDRKVIITTHGYLFSDGSTCDTNDNYPASEGLNYGDQMWDKLVKKHENIMMIACGHVGTSQKIVYSYQRGDNGNKVLQVLVDPQGYDYGTQNTGLILIMNFSADGNTAWFEYYSTLLDKCSKDQDDVIYFDGGTENTGNVDLSDLYEYGQENVYLTHNISKAPTLDGSASLSEYSTSRVIAQGDAPVGAYESDLTEYFAQDENYIYYAFSLKQTNVSQTYQFNFKPNGYLYDSATLRDEIYPRMQLKFNMSEDGTLTKYTPLTVIPASSLTPNLSLPVWGIDVFLEASRNTSTSVNTYEFKISKDYFAMNNSEYEDLDAFAYMLYLGTDANSKAIWHYFKNSDVNKNVAGCSNLDFVYNYVLFEDVLKTYEKASVRMSSTNSGLRFKTQVKESVVQSFVAKYGAENVSIGTLIAPADMLSNNVLTHDIGTEGVAYIDVKADISTPFSSEDGLNVYAGSIVNINSGNLERDFVAVGYLKVIDENGNVIYYYSDTYAKRNVNDVATAAYEDVKIASEKGYAYLVTAADDVMKGFYSPYSASQRKILKQLIVEYDNRDPGAADIF